MPGVFYYVTVGSETSAKSFLNHVFCEHFAINFSSGEMRPITEVIFAAPREEFVLPSEDFHVSFCSIAIFLRKVLNKSTKRHAKA